MLIPSSLADWFRDLWAQRTRTLSTLMGIAWGTLGVVGLMAFGTGLEDLMRERAQGLGTGIVVARGQRTTLPHAGYPEGRPVLITEDDVLALRSRIPELEAISPEYVRGERVQRGERIFQTPISGIHPDFDELRNMEVEPGGRFINERDVREGRRVMFLGDRIREQLFGQEDPLGRTVVLRGAPFTVVGTMRPKLQESDYGGMDEERICIPASTYVRVFGDRWVDYFVYRAHRPELAKEATRDVYRVLGARLGFDPEDREALWVWDLAEGDRIRETSFAALNLLMGLAGIFTLLVGGIGVGNLMFLLVRQRTREIGIRMALGARPRWILREVLLQSLVLVAAGGALGFLGAWILSAAIGASPLAENLGQPRISMTIGLGTVALLGAIGLVAGWFPARRAAHLDPVRALAD